MKAPGRPDMKAPGRPDMKAPGRPDMKVPGRPDLNTPGRPDMNTPGHPDMKTPSRPDMNTPRRAGLNIGEAASRSGVSAKMIRHYESIGLVTAERRPNGYRSYGPQNVAVLRFIRHARDLAFPLEDIRLLLALWRDRGRASAEVKRMALDHVAALEAKAASITAVADSLRHLAAHCQGDDRPECPILAELEVGKLR